MNNSELTDKARSVARKLTYNDDTPQAEAKHLLLEMAHRMDTLTIRAHKKSDGLLLVNSLGKSRFATWEERILYKLFDILPKEV